eukprot:TRINITY_DN8477_c0_g2_i9.p2 TRINITY_DN8477_c0_g2~~TRINITY_DN8477_c0_g2_i9.p2  ORF type:complete len:158 (+),score=25.04 TRINITY_DN8477_c0_g2_i9:1163-1636(+)
MDKLNRQRASILISHFLRTFNGTTGEVLTPLQVSRMEKLYFSDRTELLLGTSLQSLMPSVQGPKEFEKIMHALASQGYFIYTIGETKSILFGHKANEDLILKAYFHFVFLRESCHHSQGTSLSVLFDLFLDLAERSGWNVKSSLLGAGEWRVKIDEI